MDKRYKELEAYLKQYVNASEDKVAALQDVTHLSYVLYSEFERKKNETNSS